MSNSLTTRALIEGYNKKWVWVRVPEVWQWKILTLPREWLSHGFASFTEVQVKVDPASLDHNGHRYLADIDLVGQIDEDERTVDAE